jgi:mRNA interferase MazF
MNFSKGDVVLISYPFTDLKTTKVRPAVVVASGQGKYSDLFLVPITSKIGNLYNGELGVNHLSHFTLHRLQDIGP